jgi:formate dehydrogenase subunit delta
MSTTELDHLIKMVNQIGDNIAIGEDETSTAPKVVEHLNRFWARPMKDKIIDYASTDGKRLNSVAKLAISKL